MQRRHHRGLSTAGGAGPALGDAAAPRVVPESDPQEPAVCPDVRGPRKRHQTPAPARHPDAAPPCPDPDVGGPKKRRFGPKTTPDPDGGRKAALPNLQPQKHSLNPQKVANPDVKRLEGSNPALDVGSDTDVKGPPETAFFHPNRHRAALEVSGNPDVEERGPNPDVGGAKNGCRMLVVDSDTDVEEAEVLPDVGCPKIRRTAPNTSKTPGVEMETPNPDVGGPKNGRWALVDSDTDVETENSNSAVEGPKDEHQMLVVDSDTDVEEARAGPDVGCSQTHRTTQKVPKTRNVAMELPDTDVEGSQEGHQMLVVDSDTDVEEDRAGPDVGYPKAHQTTPNVPKPQIIEVETQNADVEGSEKGRRMLVVDSDTDVEEGGADPDVGYPKAHQMTPNVPKPRIIEVETQNADVEGSEKGRRMLVVDSDTDVEEGGADPDVGYPKAHQMTPNVPKPRIIEVETQNADVEGSEKGRRMLVVDSDTDVEEDASNPDVRCPESHRTAPETQM
ncbi:uncharacterized protein M6G45_016286 [Spheniscus humboldti]